MAAFPEFVYLPGDEADAIPVRVRVNRRAKHIFIKVENSGQPVLVLPAQRRLAEGRAFLKDKQIWLLAKLRGLPEQVAFSDGTLIPLYGGSYEIVHHPGARRAVWLVDDQINVSGSDAHLSRRLTDWLRGQAKAELRCRVRHCTQALGIPEAKVTIRDPKTRWGSCSASGGLSFSWRLILTPAPILNYVAAHECAHLIEHNHSHRFWRLVRGLEPNFRRAERWLKEKGSGLHRYG